MSYSCIHLILIQSNPILFLFVSHIFKIFRNLFFNFIFVLFHYKDRKLKKIKKKKREEEKGIREQCKHCSLSSPTTPISDLQAPRRSSSPTIDHPPGQAFNPPFTSISFPTPSRYQSSRSGRCQSLSLRALSLLLVAARDRRIGAVHANVAALLCQPLTSRRS